MEYVEGFQFYEPFKQRQLIASNKQKAASVSIKRCIVGKVASLSLGSGVCGMLFCFLFVCLKALILFILLLR